MATDGTRRGAYNLCRFAVIPSKEASLTLPPLHVPGRLPPGSKGRMRRISGSPPCACFSPARFLDRRLPRRPQRPPSQVEKRIHPPEAAKPAPREDRRERDAAAPQGSSTRRQRAAAAPHGCSAPKPPAEAGSPASDRLRGIRRHGDEEVRRELQKAKEEVKQQTAWIRAGQRRARAGQRGGGIAAQRVNLSSRTANFRTRGEFFNTWDLGRDRQDRAHALSGALHRHGGNHSQSDATCRFRLTDDEVSEDLSIYYSGLPRNILLARIPSPSLPHPFTHCTSWRTACRTRSRSSACGGVTPAGELLFGRMGYHWAWILHNDGNARLRLRDTYDRLRLRAARSRGHLHLMFDLLSKERDHRRVRRAGRSVDLDTLDDGTGGLSCPSRTPRSRSNQAGRRSWV